MAGGGGGEGGGPSALRTQGPERAASADPGARKSPAPAPRQHHQWEQAAQGGPGDDLGALVTAPRRGPAVLCRGTASWKVRTSNSP